MEVKYKLNFFKNRLFRIFS